MRDVFHGWLLGHVACHNGSGFDQLLLQMIHKFRLGEGSPRFHGHGIAEVDVFGAL